MKLSERYPEPHAQYIVLREGRLFTATPCYGMHEPWWVVRTMGEYSKQEAQPEPMQSDDEWWPIEEVSFPRLLDEVEARGREIEVLRTALERLWDEVKEDYVTEVWGRDDQKEWVEVALSRLTDHTPEEP